MLLHHRLEVLVRLLLARALGRVAGLMRKPRMASLMASMSKRISSALCSTVVETVTTRLSSSMEPERRARIATGTPIRSSRGRGIRWSAGPNGRLHRATLLAGAGPPRTSREARPVPVGRGGERAVPSTTCGSGRRRPPSGDQERSPDPGRAGGGEGELRSVAQQARRHVLERDDVVGRARARWPPAACRTRRTRPRPGRGSPRPACIISRGRRPRRRPCR
jgi:hypothetical protein